ncbi:DUF3426 domain-containing protein [Marinobacter sp. VGCF2001]|uniref:DUF3426 domain-containing protein n=1 Tax=Marinobacter sp. VGCF2001 TaxID=3417189 RepID=UPI003CFA7069
MTQSSLQTLCPNCETRFRVTDEQLSIAKGKVRCGNCMKVFNAVEHKVSSGVPKTEAGPASPSPSETPSAEPVSEQDDDQWIFADNPEEDATEGRYTGTKLTFSEDELSDSFRNVDEPEDSGYHDDELTSEHENVDESWAEAMLHDDRPPAPPTEPPSPHPEPAEATETESFSATEPATGQNRETEGQEAMGSDRQPPPQGPELANLNPADDDRVGDPMTFRAHKPTDPDTLYRDLRRDPVSVGGRGNRLRTALWTLVVLALLGVLVAQVTWYQFDRLSAIPQLRPFYEKGCEIAGCELKPLVNVEAIESRKLVVRTDPENRTQLVVDAVILNRAGFEQPFPAIALTFSNLNGDVVAQSTFTPEEYLAGEGTALTSMPVETPVRIAIRIRDPGRDAVNYNLSFRPSPQ